jgi:hypothetical protein
MMGLRAWRGRARPAATERPRDDQWPVVYFTDGADLFRVNRWLDRPIGTRLAEVENCRSLDCSLVSCDELARMSVRLVRVDAVAGATPGPTAVDAVEPAAGTDAGATAEVAASVAVASPPA